MVKLDLIHEEVNTFNFNIMASKPVNFEQIQDPEE